MATYSAARSTHQTLTASTVDTVNLTGQWQQVLITNRTGANEIYVTADGSTPTVGGTGTWVLPAAVGSRVVPLDQTTVTGPTGFPVVNGQIQLISLGAMAYSVEGIL